ncbi:MAG: hypothetical protein L0387_16090 [Acidobacteria bacterium]|nr:hypothetical protein [Acidobacteriota bacterium]MCI0724008.1 hypothetical protein [Acidobacteriota bacterium]
MITNATTLKRSPESGQTSIASYVEFLVEVINQIERCSLIRYRDRERVVDTEDLKEVSVLEHAA